MVKQLASWNSQHQVWIIANQSQLSGRWALWQEVWPKSGMTVNGSLFELPTLVHRTEGKESSFSQLPTPTTQNNSGKCRDHGGDLLHEFICGCERSERKLLLTPIVLDGDDRVMLPTPTTRDWKDSQAPHERDGVVQTDTVARAIFNSGEIDLMPTLARTETNWGKFEPAIRRWEAVTRPAPAPTKPDGKDGNHRLSSLFTEWMMGLPVGWVTGHGLKRNDELKMCGNGVVPAQAALALRYLLQDVELEKATSES